MGTIIRLKRGLLEDIEAYTPTIGEATTETNNKKNRAFIGDALTEKGYEILKGNEQTPDIATYYGSDVYGTRGFHSFPHWVEFTPAKMKTDGSASLTTAFDGIVDVISCGTGVDSAVYLVFRWSKFWNPNKNLNIQLTYALSGDTDTDEVVDLDTSIWIVDQDSTPSMGSPDYTYDETIISQSFNIDVADTIIMGETFIPAGAISGIDHKYVVVKLQRTGSGGTDTYGGTFYIINAFLYQIANAQAYGYYIGGQKYNSGNPVFSSIISRLTFPFHSGNMLEAGYISSEKESSAGFNSSTKGYVIGGGQSSDVPLAVNKFSLSTVDLMSFPFNSGTITASGTISSGRIYPGSCNSSRHGYIFGGDTGSQSSFTTLSTIERVNLTYDDAITSVASGNLSNSRKLCPGFNSSTYGYIFGAFDPNLSPSIMSFVSRILFPFDSGTADDIGTIDAINEQGFNIGTFASGTCNSSNYGYSFAGQHLSSIVRTSFSVTGAGMTTVVGNISNSRSTMAGCNSSIFGYAMGGNQYYANSEFSTLERVNFPHTSGAAILVGNITSNSSKVFAKAVGIDGTDFSTMFV